MNNVLSYDTPAWFDGALIFYALVFLARSEGGIAAGPITLLLCPLPFVFASVASSTGHWTSSVLAALVAGMVGFVLYLVRNVENAFIQTTRNKRAEALKDVHLNGSQNEVTSFPPYSMYLRPFDMGDRLPTQSVGGDWGAREHADLETLLCEAMKPLAPMVAVGPVSTATGAGRITCRDNEWQDVVTKLVARARYVFVIPSSHRGTLWELSLLKTKGHLLKCLWLMPETVTSGGWNVGIGLPSTFALYEAKRYDLAASWADVRRDATAFGIFLPAYDSAGMAFVLGDDGRVTASVPLSVSRTLFRTRRVRNACARLLARAAEWPESGQKHRATTERRDIRRRAITFAAIGLTLLGSYSLLEYGTVLSAVTSTTLGIALLYGISRSIDIRELIKRSPPHRDIAPRRTASFRRIGDKVRLSSYTSSLTIVVSPFRSLGDIAGHSIWLLFWLYIEYVVALVVWAFITRPARPANLPGPSAGAMGLMALMALFAIVWTFSGPVMFSRLLHLLRKARWRERIDFDGQVLKIYRDWEQIEHAYDFRLIKNLGIVEQHVGRGQFQDAVTFEYLGQRQSFATNLAPREAEIVVQVMTDFAKATTDTATV